MSLLSHPRSAIASQAHERYILSVDSNNRNKMSYPNQNDYQIELPHEYRRIRRVTLLSAEFTNTQYAIDTSNDTFVVTYKPDTDPASSFGGLVDEDEVVSTIQLQHGSYTGISFASRIEKQINEDTNFNDNALTNSKPINGMLGVSFDSDTRKLAFSHSGNDMNGVGVRPWIRFDVLASQNEYDTSAVRARVGYVTADDLLAHYDPDQNLLWEAMGFTQKLSDYDGINTDLPRAPSVRKLSLTPDPVRQRNFEIDPEYLRPHRTAPVVTQVDVDSDIKNRTDFFDALDFADTLVPAATVPAAPLVPPQTVNITPDRYAVLEVTVPSIMQGSLRTTGNHHKAFAKIIFRDDDQSFPFGNIYDFISSPVDFQMVGRINHIGFRLLRPNAELYDTHNHDHSFSLEILCE